MRSRSRVAWGGVLLVALGWLPIAPAAVAEEPPRREYARRQAALVEGDAEGQFKLGMWCEAKRMPDLADLCYRRTLELAPEHTKVRDKLGWKKVSEAWERDPYRAMADGIRFPTSEEVEEALNASAPGATARADVLAFLLDRKIWAAAFRRIHERLGLQNPTPEVTLEMRSLPTRGNQPAMGAGSNGVGVIYVDVEKFAALWQLLEEAWARIRAGARVTIPPVDLRSTIPHELTHVFQGRLGGGEWVIEGMASYVQQDSSSLYGLRARLGGASARLPGLDHPMGGADAYPRGWICFEYVLAKHGRAAVHTLCRALIEDQTAFPEAARAATGLDWPALVAAEQAWGETWLRRFAK